MKNNYIFNIEEDFIEIELTDINIKKTMRHHGLKAVVCGRRSSFGCSRNNHTLKGVVFVKFLDINKSHLYMNFNNDKGQILIHHGGVD